MGKMIWIACGVLLAWLALIAQPAVAEPPPLDAYGDLPAFEDAAISPSGDHVAIIGTIKGQRRLLLLDVTMSPVGQADVSGLKVRSIEWIGDDAVLLTYSETEGLSRGDFTTDKYERELALIVPLDQSKKAELVFANNGKILQSVMGRYGIRRVDGEWKGYFAAIELGYSQGIGRFLDNVGKTLFAVRFRDNDADKVGFPADTNIWRDWLIDADGSIAARMDMDRNTGMWRIENGDGKLLVRGTDNTGQVSLVSLGKDGTTLIYAAKDADGVATRWFELPLAGGSEPVEILTNDNIDSIYVERTNGRLLGYLDGDQRHFFDPRIQGLSDKISRAFPKRRVRLVDWTPDFGHVLVRTSGSTDSGTWFMVDLKALKAAAIGVERPLIPASEVGAISSFAYRASDGLEMDGILTLPPGREVKNLPVVVLPHGGPADHDVVEFNWWVQAFASRGYAVFQPNFRGSTGNSDAFRSAGDGQWGRKMQSDISDGLAALAAAGTIDAKRACIVGASYGGYAALAGVTLQQGLYRCAVAVAPVSDLSELYDTEFTGSGTSRVVRDSLLRELGPRTGLAEVSPRRFAAKADAPILLIHGRDDTVVLYQQSSKMADVLKDAGKPYEFVELKEEDHSLARAETRKQMLAAAVAFVQKYNRQIDWPATDRERILTFDAAQILANVRALTPAISARSEEIEKLRRLPDDLVAELKQAGVFRMARSRAKGGPQLTLPEQMRVIEELGYADSSVGWCVKIGADSGLIAEFLPEDASRELLPDPDMITAGQFTAGRGRLDRVEGGYLLNGRFPFGSISNHADAIMSGAVVYENGQPVIAPNGMPETRLAFARADQYVIEDTWRTHGLRGTGSNHYRAEDLFLPENQAMLIDDALFKGRDPLYSSGFNWVTTMAAVPLGIARRAMDEAKKLIAERQGGMPPRPMTELTYVRDTIAKAEMRRGSAHAFLFASADAFWAELEAGTPEVETKGRLALSNVNACRMAADVTRMLFDLIGANVIFDGSVLERLTRDALTLNQHMIVSAAHLEHYGAMMLGKEHPSPLY